MDREHETTICGWTRELGDVMQDHAVGGDEAIKIENYNFY